MIAKEELLMAVKLVNLKVDYLGPSNCLEADTADKCTFCIEGYEERFWTNGILFQICEGKSCP